MFSWWGRERTTSISLLSDLNSGPPLNTLTATRSPVVWEKRHTSYIQYQTCMYWYTIAQIVEGLNVPSTIYDNSKITCRPIFYNSCPWEIWPPLCLELHTHYLQKDESPRPLLILRTKLFCPMVTLLFVHGSWTWTARKIFMFRLTLLFPM